MRPDLLPGGRADRKDPVRTGENAAVCRKEAGLKTPPIRTGGAVDGCCGSHLVQSELLYVGLFYFLRVVLQTNMEREPKSNAKIIRFYKSVTFVPSTLIYAFPCREMTSRKFPGLRIKLLPLPCVPSVLS